MSTGMIHFLVALPAEAKPLIRAFDLRRMQPDGPFPRYGKGPFSLVLSGPGMQAAGAAIAYQLQSAGEHRNHWINLGIAGHARLAPGTCMLADSVTDATTGQCWQLSPPPTLPDTTLGPLHCVAQPESRFSTIAGYDMESAAIAKCLAEIDALSCLQILKVISDNPDHSSRRINGKMAQKLIADQLPTIAALVNHLQAHAETC